MLVYGVCRNTNILVPLNAFFTKFNFFFLVGISFRLLVNLGHDFMVVGFHQKWRFTISLKIRTNCQISSILTGSLDPITFVFLRSLQLLIYSFLQSLYTESVRISVVHKVELCTGI